MSRIFISYRRDDAGGHAARLSERLDERVGCDQVLMDLEGIRPSKDYKDWIERSLARCDVVVAVIGPRWLDVRDAHGRRRLEDPRDQLRLEIETALRRDDLAVFPVLVGGARMPDEDALPETMRRLHRLQAHDVIDGHRWSGDVDYLADEIRAEVERRTATPALAGALAGALLALWPALEAGRAVTDNWTRPDDLESIQALVRLGANHAASWALLGAGAAVGAVIASRRACAAARTAVIGALAGAGGGLLGGMIDQFIRAQDRLELGLVVGFTVTAAVAAFGRLAGSRSAGAIAGAAFGAFLGSLLSVLFTEDPDLRFILPALFAVLGAGLVPIAIRA